MLTERLELKQQAITPMKQSYQMGCGPTAISMVLSGFGVDISEQILIDRYFPTAALPMEEEGAGVDDKSGVLGILQVLEDEHMQESLQMDFFSPTLCRYTSSLENRYIVPAKPDAAKSYAGIFKENGMTKDLYETLALLAKKGQIGLYTPNGRLIKHDTKGGNIPLAETAEAQRGLNQELVEFVKKGHLIGEHKGAFPHFWAVDGTKTTEEGYWLVDPADGESSLAGHYLVMIDSYFGVEGDKFSYMVRVSPREKPLNPQQHGFLGFLQNAGHLIP